ncbi:carbohydrate esterase family 4 protein [Sporormia fimetaria CBS 119925]|uniref:Carbohydrate esterase family 4 protein n=1 Tax=Sporormia fimetaria CBS 119925 TaxID=1340428 RepID=A0A6A6V3J1_9PLEO|nr:carbohydrate esterase family 4 protein [Sporormia fimetaria CBS 119925]
MRFSDLFAVSLAVPMVAAHGSGAGLPKIFGLGDTKLRLRQPSNSHAKRVSDPHQDSQLVPRQGLKVERCGPENGGVSCEEGYCCSIAGWCGNSKDYCKAPDCMFEYGPACDANKVPSGPDTTDVDRSQRGSIPVGGEGVYHCKVPGTVAITYDDGPFEYTEDILDQLKEADVKATFFVTGNNIGKGTIDDPSKPWPALLRRMIEEGHQIGSHTWSHEDLGKIKKEDRISQMIKLEMAVNNVLGYFPTYMRPPYSSCAPGTGCQEDMADLGYVISYFDVNTDDYNQNEPEDFANAQKIFDDFLVDSNSDTDKFLAIAHDIVEQTASKLTGHMIKTLKEKGYRGVTMGECLDDPKENWYRSNSTVPSAGASSTASTSSPASTGTGSATEESGAPEASSTGETQTSDGTRFSQSGFWLVYPGLLALYATFSSV